MMDNDFELRDFANVTRLFPLPNLVMFPHVVLPLHIFEPRYRQMTEDALAGDRLITMVQITPPARGEHWTEPVPLSRWDAWERSSTTSGSLMAGSIYCC